MTVRARGRRAVRPRAGATRSCIALVLAAVLLGGCGGDDAATAPSAGPAPADATPSPSAPTSTVPVPTATPTAVPAPAPPPGTTIAGEQLSAEDAAELQHEVDEGHQPWRTDVAAVAESFTRQQLGWGDVGVALADPHTAEVTHRADGHMVTLQLRQPAREGSGGIWIVVSGVWLS